MKKNKIIIWISILLIVLVIGITTIVLLKDKKSENKLENYYEIKLEKYFEPKEGILVDDSGYESLINELNLEKEDINIKMNFKNNDYLYYIYNYSPCTETINYKPLTYNDTTVTINIDVEMSCGFCALEYLLLIIPVDKGIVKDVEVNIDVQENEECEYEIDKKPILYLYPTKETNVSVKIKNSDKIITSYPKYDNGWNVVANPNGDLYDQNNKYYYALYWDENNMTNVDFSEGFYVTKESAISFLEEKLSLIGLNAKEQNEFIMYWLPKLEKNEKSLVYFELTEERQNSNELIIEPKPDSLLRINMHIKKVDEKVQINEQILPSFERKGFVAVEWGGTIH